MSSAIGEQKSAESSQSGTSDTKRWSLKDLLGEPVTSESDMTPSENSPEQPKVGKSGPPRPRLAPKDAILGNNCWYWFSPNEATPQEAQLAAARVKGRLLVISSDQENAFITARLKGPTLLGMAKIKGVWMAGAGRPQKYFNWDWGQPSSSKDERFASIHGSGRWHDHLGASLYFCIEWGKER